MSALFVPAAKLNPKNEMGICVSNSVTAAIALSAAMPSTSAVSVAAVHSSCAEMSVPTLVVAVVSGLTFEVVPDVFDVNWNCEPLKVQTAPIDAVVSAAEMRDATPLRFVAPVKLR